MSVLSLALCLLLLGDPPKVVTLEPANGAKEVDAAKVTKLVVTFDKSMDLSGWSFCGGGPNFPKFKGKPKWETPKKVVVEVELEPDHEYKLGLNCPSAQNFRSSQAVALVPVPWSFKTAPAKGAAKKAPTTGDSASEKGATKKGPGDGSEPPKGAVVVGASTGTDAAAPKVVGLEPGNMSMSVDAAKTTQIVVDFDRPMRTTGWSFCGGGPKQPKFKGTPRWETPQKIVVDVELEPDHEYTLLLNCPAGTNFRSAEGVALAPTSWSFTTAPAGPVDPSTLPDPAKQKAENAQAFDALKKTLAESYSYYDLRVASRDELYRQNEARILGAATTREWAGAVSAMLAATEDLHLHLKLGDATFPGGTRAIDPLYREKLIARYAMVQPVGGRCQRGRTDDGIGYVMIGGWTDAKDVDALEAALPGLKDCRAIVVDVRPNAGGDEMLARRIAAWFVDGEHVYGKDRFRTGAGKDGFGPVLDRSITGNAEPEKRLAMPVALLTSRCVMSSNESFVLMMRQAKDCTVVGQKTYGSSGNPKPHDLPNGVTIFLPSWQDLRLDGTCFEGEGLAPDVEVAADPKDFEEKDPILERALEILRGKVGKPGEKKG